MLVIVSGCDGSGKTTLCEYLASKLNGKYTHFSYPKSKKEAKDEYFSFIDSLDDKIYICDRFYEGEYVYAPIYRGYELGYSREIENYIKSKTNVLYIYVTAKEEILKDRLSKRGEDYIKDKDIGNICKRYNDFLNQLRLPYLVIDNNSFLEFDYNLKLCEKQINKTNKIMNYHRTINKGLPFGNTIPNTILALEEITDEYIPPTDKYTDYFIASKDYILQMLEDDNQLLDYHRILFVKDI